MDRDGCDDGAGDEPLLWRLTSASRGFEPIELLAIHLVYAGQSQGRCNRRAEAMNWCDGGFISLLAARVSISSGAGRWASERSDHLNLMGSRYMNIG
jgi:hypothetical protein